MPHTALSTAGILTLAFVATPAQANTIVNVLSTSYSVDIFIKDVRPDPPDRDGNQNVCGLRPGQRITVSGIHP